MKKLLFFALAILVFACTEKEPAFNIEVTLDGAVGKVVLEKNVEGSLVGVDTAEIVDGVAILKGAVEYPAEYYLSVNGERPKTIVFIENNKMKISGNVNALEEITVTGSITHNEYQQLNDTINGVIESYNAVYQEARMAIANGDTVKGRELLEKVNVLYEGIDDLQVDFVKEKTGSFLAPFILTSIQYDKEADVLDELVNGLDENVQQVPAIQQLKERIEKLKKLAVGQIAPDFIQNDPDGNPVKFSDIYSQNEITLLDFWASWCQPCRVENPNIVAVYNEYKDQGFTVFGVSLDMEKDSWLKAIEDDQLDWTQVSDLEYWGNEVAKEYAVNSIPSSLLVDKTGKIIAKNIRGEALGLTVSELLD